MKFLVIKPRGEQKLGNYPKSFAEFDVKKLQSFTSFIQQQVGRHPVKRVIGDYTIWISDPNKIIQSEQEIFEVPDKIDLTCNLMLNEVEFAYGNVVVTSNHRVSSYDYEGLTDQDIGNIMNSFTLSRAILVQDITTGKQVAVDRIFDTILSPNGINNETPVTIQPNIPNIPDEVPDEYGRSPEDFDPDFE